VPAELFDYFRAKSEVRLRKALASGEYVGWLATEGKSLQNIVAGAGVQLRRVLPYPISEPGDKIRICDGRQGIILNVFTEPNWRRRGVAALLLKTIVEWSRNHGLGGLVLHASDEGRSLYEQLGFVSTNEVQREFGHRFQRRLGAASDHRALPRRLQHRSQHGEREQGDQESQVIPNGELVPKQVVIRNEQCQQHDSKNHCCRPPAVRDPRSDKSARNRSHCPQDEPGQLHPEGKVKGGFRLMVVRPPHSQWKIHNCGDKDPGDEPEDNGRDRSHGRPFAEVSTCRSVSKRAFHISLIVIL